MEHSLRPNLLAGINESGTSTIAHLHLQGTKHQPRSIYIFLDQKRPEFAGMLGYNKIWDNGHLKNLISTCQVLCLIQFSESQKNDLENKR